MTGNFECSVFKKPNLTDVPDTIFSKKACGTFPTENQNFSKESRSIECLYEGALIIGTEKLLKWEISKTQMAIKLTNST